MCIRDRSRSRILKYSVKRPVGTLIVSARYAACMLHHAQSGPHINPVNRVAAAPPQVERFRRHIYAVSLTPYNKHLCAAAPVLHCHAHHPETFPPDLSHPASSPGEHFPFSASCARAIHVHVLFMCTCYSCAGGWV
eukprot:2331416-Prymnesium_polylepis.1